MFSQDPLYTKFKIIWGREQRLLLFIWTMSIILAFKWNQNFSEMGF